jgi:hypothetical protein
MKHLPKGIKLLNFATRCNIIRPAAPLCVQNNDFFSVQILKSSDVGKTSREGDFFPSPKMLLSV